MSLGENKAVSPSEYLHQLHCAVRDSVRGYDDDLRTLHAVIAAFVALGVLTAADAVDWRYRADFTCPGHTATTTECYYCGDLTLQRVTFSQLIQQSNGEWVWKCDLACGHTAYATTQGEGHTPPPRWGRCRESHAPVGGAS